MSDDNQDFYFLWELKILGVVPLVLSFAPFALPRLTSSNYDSHAELVQADFKVSSK